MTLPAGLLICLSLVLASATGSSAAAKADDLLDDLKQLRSSSKDRVITFTDSQLQRFTGGKTRPYDLVVFLSARQVMDNPQLNIGGLRKEYALVAKAALKGPAPDAAFFVEMVYEDAPQVFHALEARQVPYIFKVAGSQRYSFAGQASAQVPRSQRMSFDTVQERYPWSAQVIADFFAKTGVQFGQVQRSGILHGPNGLLILGAMGGALIGLTIKLFMVGFFQHPAVLAVASIVVVWFSTSGGMYNIIRGMPMYIIGRDGKPQYFLGSRSGQLGAEGFIAGSGYVLFSAAVSLLTYGVPRVSMRPLRALLSLVMVAAAAAMAIMQFNVFQTKTGYRVSSYLLR